MQQVISGAMLALKLVSAYFLIVALFALKKPKPIPRANPKNALCLCDCRAQRRAGHRGIGTEPFAAELPEDAF